MEKLLHRHEQEDSFLKNPAIAPAVTDEFPPDPGGGDAATRTGEGPGAKGVSAFLVPADRPGLSGAPLDMLSPHPIGSLAFDGVPVGPQDLLGEPGRGFRVASTCRRSTARCRAPA